MIGLFAYPWDFTGATLDVRLDELRAMGIERLVLATLYHDARQLLPRGENGKLVWVEGGQSYVPVNGRRYPAGLAPPAAETQLDAMAIAAAARVHGLQVAAWTVTLHRDDLRCEANPDLPRVVNAFGDVALANLCPAATSTGGYMAAHVADLADAGFDTVVLEGLQYPPLAHGAHHESIFAPLGRCARWLLSLCFCEACRAGAAASGLDASALQRSVQRAVDQALDGDDRAAMRLAGEPELEAFARMRCNAVRDLLESATRLASVVFADQGVVAGRMFLTGAPPEEPAPAAARRLGVDCRAIANAVSRFAALGYLREPNDLAAFVDAYMAAGIAQDTLSVVLRPFPPDSPDEEALRQKLEVLAARGIDDVDFYNLGFARQRDLRNLAAALRGR